MQRKRWGEDWIGYQVSISLMMTAYQAHMGLWVESGGVRINIILEHDSI